MRIWGSEDIWESVLSVHPVGMCVVMLVCVQTTYLWRLEDNFWEAILSSHPCFRGTDSAHQACVVSTFTHFAITIASTLFFRFIVRYSRAVGTRVRSNIYLFFFIFICSFLLYGNATDFWLLIFKKRFIYLLGVYEEFAHVHVYIPCEFLLHPLELGWL